MSNGVHFAFHLEVLACIQADKNVQSKVAGELQEYKNAFKAEDEALVISRKSFLSDEIAKADDERDSLYSAFKNTVKAFSNLPDPAARQACKVLGQAVKDYRINVDDQLDKETGMLTNMLTDLRGKYREEVETLSLTSLVDALYDANERVRNGMRARNEEKVGKSTGAMKKARLFVDKMYNLVVKLINACALAERTNAYDACINSLNAIIDHFQQQAIGEKVSKPAGDDEIPNPVAPAPPVSGGDPVTPPPGGGSSGGGSAEEELPDPLA